MRRRYLLPLAGAGGMALAGCGVRLRRDGATRPAAGDGVPRVEVTEAFRAAQAGRAVIVDVRSAEAYRTLHATGAVLLSLDEIERAPQAAASALPAGKRPILYCT